MQLLGFLGVVGVENYTTAILFTTMIEALFWLS